MEFDVTDHQRSRWQLLFRHAGPVHGHKNMATGDAPNQVEPVTLLILKPPALVNRAVYPDPCFPQRCRVLESPGRLASNFATRVMSPGKHPPERAQNGTVTPAIGRAAASHGAHALDKTPHDGEKQIQTQDPPNHPPHHLTSSLSG